MAFQKACKKEEVNENSANYIELNGKQIALFNINGNFYAISNTCLHRGGPLAEGSIDEEHVICPLHGWEYDIPSGKCITNPTLTIERFDVKIEGDDILIDTK